MTSHRVRLCHSESGADSYHGWLDQWLTNMEPWEHPEVENTLPKRTEPIDDNTPYYRGELAFDWTEDKAHILDNLDQYAAAYCEWHRIGYHVCEHDEEDGGPCSWDDNPEGGSVPTHVPTFE